LRPNSRANDVAQAARRCPWTDKNQLIAARWSLPGSWFTDVHLPDLSGIELAHRIATLHRGILVIFASGDTVQDIHPGDFHWQSLRKPYAVDQLDVALRKARRDNA
jgi:FixJ family two-component response regulator